MFGVAFVFGELPMREILLVLSVAAMFVASVVAVFQTDVKRMLAYSSVAQIGYITLGIGLASQTGLTGGIVHLFNHALTKGALFMLAGRDRLPRRQRQLRRHRRHRPAACRSRAPAS